jgi:hypothetical protein
MSTRLNTMENFFLDILKSRDAKMAEAIATAEDDLAHNQQEADDYVSRALAALGKEDEYKEKFKEYTDLDIKFEAMKKASVQPSVQRQTSARKQFAELTSSQQEAAASAAAKNDDDSEFDITSDDEKLEGENLKEFAAKYARHDRENHNLVTARHSSACHLLFIKHRKLFENNGYHKLRDVPFVQKGKKTDADGDNVQIEMIGNQLQKADVEELIQKFSPPSMLHQESQQDVIDVEQAEQEYLKQKNGSDDEEEGEEEDEHEDPTFENELPDPKKAGCVQKCYELQGKLRAKKAMLENRARDGGSVMEEFTNLMRVAGAMDDDEGAAMKEKLNDIATILKSKEFRKMHNESLGIFALLVKLRKDDVQESAQVEDINTQLRKVEQHEILCKMNFPDKKEKAIQKALELEMAAKEARLAKERAAFLGRDTADAMSRAHKRSSVAGSVKGEPSSASKKRYF